MHIICVCFSLGFVNWSKRDYIQFVQLNEKFGRDDIEKITQNFEGKTPEQVLAYHNVFWKRCKDLQDYDRVIAQIERGEAKHQRKHNIKRDLDAKVKHVFVSLILFFYFLYYYRLLATENHSINYDSFTET